MFGRKKRIYMDYAAATPLLPEVQREMDKYWSREFYNPSAIYEEGVAAKLAVEECRARVARVLGAGKKDIVFTGGGTESNNLAVIGAFEEFKELGGPTAKGRLDRPHIVLSAVEHPAVRLAALEVERRGTEVSVAGVDKDGLVDPQEISKLIRPDTFLVSVMLANNEIGTVEPVAKIGRLVRAWRKERGSRYPYFHTDASQTPSYLDINIEKLHADMMTLDGSKIYGPKGSGALVVRPSASIRPYTVGGGQERGLRAGTENTALIAGFAKALEVSDRDRQSESERLRVLKNFFIDEVRRRLPEAEINGSTESSLPNIVSVALPGVLSEMLVLALDREGIMASVGSACSMLGNVSGSDVIRALGKDHLAESSVRFSFGRGTGRQDVEKAVRALCRAAEKCGRPRT